MTTKRCRCCGKEFTAKNNAAQFCSVECKKRYRNAKARAFNKTKKYTKKCPRCGKVFTALRGVNYCSVLCSLMAKGKINGVAKPKTRKPVKSLEEVAKICGELQISYGEYMTRYGGDE